MVEFISIYIVVYGKLYFALQIIVEFKIDDYFYYYSLISILLLNLFFLFIYFKLNANPGFPGE